MRVDVIKYQCDNCKRITYTDKSMNPVGWRRLQFGDESDNESQDICFSCAEAVTHSLGRRKAIERGSPEKEIEVVHLDDGQVARQTALLLAPRVAKPTANDE